ncbi:LOW QUALITY PROTEIN: hypothetical protein ACHAW6_000557, partial [Cyclotella cf. meneghiniana]
DEDHMAKVAVKFANRSNYVINSCICASDGWIVKIVKPSITKIFTMLVILNHSSVGRFFLGSTCRQLLISKSASCTGTSIVMELSMTQLHLITADSISEKNCQKLVGGQYYFIGDSAHAIKSFLLTPFDNAVHGTTEDNFNFFHSSSHIVVECAFREIYLRWGIL